jgi:tRNA U34 5-methylaminomethyl-2-thiouridine-forming methyltransferase MnmC
MIPTEPFGAMRRLPEMVQATLAGAARARLRAAGFTLAVPEGPG